MTEESKTVLRVVRDESLAHEWELVLLSQGLSPQLQYAGEDILLTVPRRERDRALAGLAAYERESTAKAQPQEMTPEVMDLWGGLIAALLLVGFYIVTAPGSSAASWVARGSANAAKILHGELWRTVTALTLHADVAHALSNALAIAVFLGALSAQLGRGVAGALVLFAGALGNLANAYLQGSPHDALGASTAVFGAVGMLGGFAMLRRGRMGNKRRAWIGIAAALALLGMLGSGGVRVDVVAHSLGFLAGLALSLFFAFVSPRLWPAHLQWTCALAAFGTIAYCWILALF